jgi:hypothetical protein
MTAELVAFLNARLDEREELAQAEADMAAEFFPPEQATLEYGWYRHTKRRTSGGSGTSFAPGAPSPTEVLADIAAKRAIVNRCTMAVGFDLAAAVLKDLTTPYAEHRDYQPEWRP